MPTITQPRILNFDNAGTSGYQQGNTTPATVASPWGTTMNHRGSMINDLNEHFKTPRNLESSNFLNSNTTNTNSMNVDAGIGPNMAREIQQKHLQQVT